MSRSSGRSCQIFHGEIAEAIGVEEFSKIGQNEINILVCWCILERGLEQNCLLEQIEKSLLFVHTLSDLVESSLFPEIGHDIELVGEDIADNGGVDVFLLLQKLVTQGLGNLLELGIILVGDDVGKSFFPVAEGGADLLVGGHVVNDAGEVIFGDGLDNFLNKWILVLLKVLSFDLLVKILTTCLGDEKSFGSSSAFESYLGSIFKFTDKQVLLDGSLGSFIPIDVS